MADLATLMTRATADLRFIQVLLEDAARSDADLAQRRRVLEDLSGSSCLEELKAAVDGMRHVLWSYVEASAGRRSDVAQALQTVRMQRVTEMLRTLQADVQQARLAPSSDTANFIEMVTQVAQATMERHREPRAED
jgi:hypothetical protein